MHSNLISRIFQRGPSWERRRPAGTKGVIYHARTTLLMFALLFTSVPCSVAADLNANANTPPNTSETSPLQASVQSGVVVSPAPTRTLSLASCFDTADKHNKEILSAAWNLTIAKGAITAAGAIPNPQFQLQEGFGPAFTSILTGQSVMVQLTQDVQTAGKRSKKVAVARANFELAVRQLDALRFSVHNRVRRAYAEQAAAEAYEELIESQRAVGVKLLAIAQKRYQAGKAPQTEVLQAQLNVSQFDTQRNQAQIREQQDSAALAQLIGEIPEKTEVIDVDDNGLFKLSAEKTDIVPSPTRIVPPLDQLLATGYGSRPDLKAAEQQVYANRRALSLARTQRIPDVFVGGGYQWSQWAPHQFPGLSPVPNSIGSGTYITVSCENPLFYQYQGQVQQAIATLRQSERQVDATKCQVATDVTTALNEVAVARANIFLFEKDVLPTAAEVARVARKGYEFGATDLATAIVAQQQYQQTLSSFFDAVVAYQTAWADLENAVGVPLRL
jgi:outer membrane protein, heavy metal efflux system